ncbi:hypothetical protein RI367_000934 [Sorochytrium milnesiophthora]
MPDSKYNGVRGGMWFLKNTVLLVNVMTLIAGVGFMAIGLYGFMNKNVVGIVSESLPMACVILGVGVALISCVGCCGAANESKIFMRVYIGMLVLLIIAQIVVGVIAFSHKDDVEYHLSSWWQTTHEQNPTGLESVQDFFGCCGFHTLTDMPATDTCPSFMVPCYEKLKTSFEAGAQHMASAAVGLSLVELFCLIAASVFVHLARAMEASRDTSLLEEARKLQLRELESSKAKRYNFENPFDDDDD